MAVQTGSALIASWPYESQEAAQIVLDTHGEPDEATATTLTWHNRGPWKRIVATKTFYRHSFPAPHTDSVESFIDYRVPTSMFTPIVEFDGSVIAERTAGEVSARCHDEQANFLALNLMHDLVNGTKNVHEARDYYAKEFLDYRRNKPTPYMEGLRFTLPSGETGDPDVRVISDAEIEQAKKEGEGRS